MTKHRVCFLPLAAVLFLLWSACGKNNATPDNQYSKFFRNTLWAGEFKYTARAHDEPVGIIFNENGSFIWREMDADVAGTYTIDDNSGQLDLTFTVSGSKMTARVSKEGALSDFRYGQATWEVKTLSQSTISTTQLSKTAWKNTADLSTIDFLDFDAASQVANSYHKRKVIYAQNNQVVRFGYRSEGPIKVDFHYLLVQVSDRNMIGLEKRVFVLSGITNYYKVTMTKE